MALLVGAAGCGHRTKPRLPGPSSVSVWLVLCKNNLVALLTSYYYPSLAVHGLSELCAR